MSDAPEQIPDLPEVDVGGVGNHYGGLSIRCIDGRPEWSIENWDGHHWQDCPITVFHALKALIDKDPSHE